MPLPRDQGAEAHSHSRRPEDLGEGSLRAAFRDVPGGCYRLAPVRGCPLVRMPASAKRRALAAVSAVPSRVLGEGLLRRQAGSSVLGLAWLSQVRAYVAQQERCVVARTAEI